MATHAETSDPAAVSTEFGAALDALEIKQRSAAQWFRTSERNIRRWKSGDRRTPPAVGIVLRLLAAKVITISQIEQAADSVLARNGSAKGEPSAHLRVEPDPEPDLPASLRVERAPVPAEAAAALTPVKINSDAGPGAPPPRLVAPAPEPAVIDRDQTLAEKVLALTGCRWPHNDPRHPDFFFCDAAVTEPPYCPYHRRAAFMTRSPPETRPGFRLRGLAPPMKRPLVRCPAHAGEKQTDGSCF
jgi:hypothetical protein